MTDQEPPKEAEPSPRRINVPWGVTDAMIGFAILACGSLVSLLALGRLLGSLERQTDGVTTVVLFLLQVLMVVTVWLLAVKWRGASLTNLGLGTSGLHWPKVVGWAALALGLSIVAGIIYQLVVAGLGIESLEPSPVPERLLGEGVLRVFTVGTLVVVAIVKVPVEFVDAPIEYLAFAIPSVVLILYSHRENMMRLRRGVENRLDINAGEDSAGSDGPGA